jgi:NitT/TauT family transport system substrate-binding protein
MKLKSLLARALVTTSLIGLSFGAHAETPAPLSIGLNTYAGYGLLYLAQEKGFFKAHGTDVRIVNTEDKASTAAAIAGKRLDGWVTTVDTFIFYDAAKLQLQQVLGISFSAGGEGIISTAQITQPSQLRGKTIAVEEGSPGYFFLLNVLADNKIPLKDVKLLSMKGADAGAAFVAGKVDVAATWQPWLSKADKRPGGHILVDTRSKPGLIADTLALRSDVIKNRPKDVTGFIEGYNDAYAYWHAHEEEADGVIAKALGISVDELKRELEVIHFASPDANRHYLLDQQGIRKVVARGVTFYRDAGLLKSDQNPTVLVNTQPFEAATAQH